MNKAVLVLLAATVGLGLVSARLVRELQEERANAQTLQTRVTELEKAAAAPRAAPPPAALGVPNRSPFAWSVTPRTPAPQAAHIEKNVAEQAVAAVAGGATVLTPPSEEAMREQIRQSMEQQRALLRDPEYRDAVRAQARMNFSRSYPDVVQELGLTPEQTERFFALLADQQLQAMDPMDASFNGDPLDPSRIQEAQQKGQQRQAANDAELTKLLGKEKVAAWKEYQETLGARYEADQLRALLASAGVPLDDNLAKPLRKAMAEQQRHAIEDAAKLENNAVAAQLVVSSSDSFASALPVSPVAGPVSNEDPLEFMVRQNQHRREALSHLLTPQQLSVIEEQQNAELQMQRAQLRLMRAQAEAAAAAGQPATNSLILAPDVQVNYAGSN